MSKFINQSGRSMVEMLGVLAVIGVLTLGGIAGYRLAINHYRANETVDEIGRDAVMMATQMIANDEITKFEGVTSPTRMGYSLDAYPTTDGFFEIKITAVPTKVCEQVLRLGFKAPSAIYVDNFEVEGDNGKCGEGQTADMIFEFQKDFDTRLVNPK